MSGYYFLSQGTLSLREEGREREIERLVVLEGAQNLEDLIKDGY